MAKKAYLKGEEFVFTRVKGSFETDYRDGDVNIDPTNLGLGNVNNTSDTDKPVSTAQRKAIDDAYANSNKYTDQKIADLIGGASETMDTLKEVEQAIASSKSTEEALNKAIGTKANQTELDTHTGNDTIHITASEREKWNKNGGVTGIRGETESDYKTGQVTISKEDIGLGNVDNTKDADKNVNSALFSTFIQSSVKIKDSLVDDTMPNTSIKLEDVYSDNVKDGNNFLTFINDDNGHQINASYDTKNLLTTFESGDSATGDSTAPAVITSGETHQTLFNKISTAVKNVRWLLSKMGTTDISAIGNGTVTGALSTLNSNITIKSIVPYSGYDLTNLDSYMIGQHIVNINIYVKHTLSSPGTYQTIAYAPEGCGARKLTVGVAHICYGNYIVSTFCRVLSDRSIQIFVSNEVFSLKVDTAISFAHIEYLTNPSY